MITNLIAMYVMHKYRGSTCLMQIAELKSHENDLINEYESKLQEMARLLDIKSARVQQLDSKLKSIAYGTQTFKFDTPERVR